MARPVGSKNLPKLSDYYGKENKEKLANKALELALAGDPAMLRFLLEQIYGKAPQPITGEDGGAVNINISKDIAEKCEVDPITSDNSEGQTSV